MHLKVSHNFKTLLSAPALKSHHIKDTIQEAIQSGCIAPAAAAHGGISDPIKLLKAFEAMSTCVVETQPVVQEALRLRSANLMASLCFLYDCHIG